MKCRKPNTDQEVELTVSADGFPCTEHILPYSTSSEPNVIERFIPVSDGVHLTINGHFSGTVLHGAFDLLADGSFVGDKRIEAKNGELKYYNKRTLKFQDVYDTPKPPGYTSIYTPRDVVKGSMHVKPLDDSPGDFEGSRLGVGSIALIISVNQKSSENYNGQYLSTICGQWKEEDSDDCRDGGVVPTHEIQVKVTDDNVHKNQQSKHRRHLQQTRFGSKPWAKIIFYYRTIMAIHEAGCISAADKFEELEAGPDDFVRASHERSSKKKGAKDTDADGGKDGDQDEIAVASSKKRSVSTSTSPTTTNPKKQKLLGQSLFKRNDSDSLFVSESPSPADVDSFSGQAYDEPKDADGALVDTSTTQDNDSDNGLTAFNNGRDKKHHDELHKNGVSSPAASTAKPNVVTAASLSSRQNREGTKTLPKLSDQEVNGVAEKAIADAGINLAGDQEDVAAEAASATKALADHSSELSNEQNGSAADILRNMLERKKNDAVTEVGKSLGAGQRNGAAAATSTVQASVDGIENIAGAVPEAQATEVRIKDEPKVEVTNSTTTFTAQHQAQRKEQVQLSKSPITTINGPASLTLEPRALAPDLDTKSVAKAREEAALAEPQPKVTIKTEPMDKNMQPDQTYANNASTQLATSPQVPSTPNPILKRTGSNSVNSRESTPSKKTKLMDLEAKKAALVAQLEEKRQATLAAKREIEEQRKRREQKEREKRQQEEALEKEIRELEQMNAEEDEELEELRRATEQEEAEMEMEE